MEKYLRSNLKITDKEYNYIGKIIENIPEFKDLKVNLSLENFIKKYKNNKHFLLLQYMSLDTYKNIISEIKKSYENDVYFFTKMFFDLFLIYLNDIEIYKVYLQLIDKIKENYPKFKNHLNVLHNFVIDYVYNEYNLLIEKKENLEICNMSEI